MIEKLLRSADFERVLRTRTRASSSHFALHHLGVRPSRAPKRGPRPTEVGPAPSATEPGELSTAPSMDRPRTVDDSSATASRPDRIWLGAVVPKRHARRAVTRSLLKRQIRSVVARHRERLAAGLWVVRLRAPFDRAHFASAASEALRSAARDELDALFGQAAARAGR